jgi:hypothetical protein
MSDKIGMATAAAKGITLGQVGQQVVLENEHVRIWQIDLEPGETIDFHIHFHPYIIVSLGGGENEIETIFGDRITTNEPLGSIVFMSEMRPVHRLTNRAKIPYRSRLIELKSIRWPAE